MQDNQNGTLVTVDLTDYTNLWVDVWANGIPVPGTPFTAALLGTGSQGIIKYTVSNSGFFFAQGTWMVRGIIQNPTSGTIYTGSWIIFSVDK